MLDRYNFLHEHVPKTSTSILNAYTRAIEKKREDIIKKHRTSALVPLLSSTENFGEMLPDNNFRPTFVFKPTEVIPPRVSPQLLQQASHLYTFLHQHTPQLFEAILKLRGTPQYSYLLNSSVPSLFGYFSSQEHLQLAFSFYIHPIAYKNKEIAIEFLKPFFHAPGMFRFHESFISSFCNKLLYDQKLMDSKNKNMFIQKYADELASCIKSAAHSLLHSYKSLLQFIYEQWKIKDGGKFLIQTVLQQFTNNWFILNGYDKYSDFVNSVFDLIYNDETRIRTIFRSIIESNAKLEIPDMYNVFGHQYILFAATSSDIMELAKAISDVTDLPNSLTTLKGDTNPKHALFWFKIFPKRRMPSVEVMRPLVFPTKDLFEAEEDAEVDRIFRRLKSAAEEVDADPYAYLIERGLARDTRLADYALARTVEWLSSEAAAFERLMQSMQNYGELEKWHSVASAHAATACAAVAAVAVRHAVNRGYRSVRVAFSKASALFSTRALRRAQYLRLLQAFLPQILSELDPELRTAQAWWEALLARRLAALDETCSLGLRSPTSNGAFWECVERLRAVGLGSVAASFGALLDALRAVRLVERAEGAEGLLERAAVLGGARGLFPFYLIVGAAAMDCNTFRYLCSETEIGAWIECESAMLRMISTSAEIGRTVIMIQEKIRAMDNRV